MSRRIDMAMLDGARWLIQRKLAGQDLTATAHHKLVHEAKELEEHPEDISEYADVLLCLVGAATKQGFSLTDLTNAVDVKVAQNRADVWKQDEDGTWSRVRSNNG